MDLKAQSARDLCWLAGSDLRNIDMFVPTNCYGLCLVCPSVCLSVSSKVPNVWLLNERENVLVSRAAGIKQSSQIELWTVHFVKPILVF